MVNWFHLGLAALMLITGSINTLSVKWADTMTSESSDGVVRGFRHPFLQACGMFLGEMMCMLAFFAVRYSRKRKLATPQEAENDPMTRKRNFSPLIFWPPALCDMTATSIQYIGLTLTYASSFQMLRGAVIIFTGLLSKFALGRNLRMFRWFGIAFVIAGLAVVGMCDMIYKPDSGHHNGTDVEQVHFNAEYLGNIIRGVSGSEPDNKTSSDVLLGDLLIVCAQVIVATQMVYEEKFVSKYDIPALQAVGWEGTWGFVTLSALLVPMYFIPVGPKFGANPRHVLEDAYDGLYQLAHNGNLAMAFTATIFSIAFFNFAGISVTKEMSATTRMVLDSVRTLVIWGVSLGVGWQAFHALQLLGFALLCVGMCIYNDLVFAPLWRKFTMGNSAGDPYAQLDEEPVQEEEDAERTIFEPPQQQQSEEQVEARS